MESFLIIGGLIALVILLATKAAKSETRREVSQEVLERVKRSKRNRASAKRKSVIDKLRAIAKERNS